MNIKFLSLVSLVSVVFYLPIFSQTILPVDNPKQWMEQRFAKGVVPPFSFVYGGKKSDSFIRNWQYRSEKIASSEPNKEIYVYSYSDRATGLTVKCTVTCFNDFSAVEWVLQFSNMSEKNTPIIEKVAVSDHSFSSGSNGTFTLHHAKGSRAGRDDFQPIDEPIQVGKNIYMSPPGGRSSNTTTFPFFNIAMPGERGIVVAVGWTGGWYADVAQTDAKTVSLKSGMEKMQLTLYPGEEIRTPKICLLFWKGEDRMIGHNRFRQFILTHHSRKINGQFAEYPLTGLLRLHEIEPCGEFECTTEESLKAIVRQHRLYDMMPEAFWLDAGWYEGCGWNKPNGSWWTNVGNWTPDKERFPNGLRPVADAIHEAGSKFMVWFEPERVYAQTFIHREHPEWLLKREGSADYLFDLGNRDARIWLTDHISEIIKKEGIDYYRQDFNMDPSPYWTANDQPGRIGMSEIGHIEGLYAFWDSLLVRFPNLLIDNCASGGRRIDLETTSRSAPLWRTDYSYFEPIGKQCHIYGLNFFLPIHGTAATIENDFTFRSGISATTTGYWLLGRGKETVPESRKYMQQFKELRPYFYGDYYPLTSTLNYTNNDVWLAYQLNRPKEKDGIIMAYRRQDNQQISIRIKLSGLEKDAVYELYDEDSGIRQNHTGSELMNGFDIAIPQKPASSLIKYRKIDILLQTPVSAINE